MIDLLRVKVIGALAASKTYPLAVRILTLVCFILLIAGGLAAPSVSAKLAGILRDTNLASLIVWSLWWPLVIISSVLFGRVWCQVCPMEFINSLSSRIGLRRRVPAFIRSGWGGSLFYAVSLLILIRTLWAHRFPRRMALFFLVLFGTALLMGLIFEKRAFCDFLCPVGRLLGLYAGVAPFEWRVRAQETCQACRTKDCIDPERAHGIGIRSCSSGLYPPALTDNRRCLVCTNCRKVCPNDNLRFSLRRPFSDFFSRMTFSTPEFILVFLASGLVTWEIGEEWDAAEAVLSIVPNRVIAALGVSGEAANLAQALVLFVGLPSLLIGIPALLGKWINRNSLLDSARTFSLLLLPLVAVTHMAKALFRIPSRMPYYHLAIQDPIGFDTATRLADGRLSLDKSLPAVLGPFITWPVLLALGACLLFIWLIAHRSPAFTDMRRSGRIFLASAASAYGLMVLIIVCFARFG